MRRMMRLGATLATLSTARCAPSVVDPKARIDDAASLSASDLVRNQHANGRRHVYDTPRNTDDTLGALRALFRLGADAAPAIDAACDLQWVSLLEGLLVDHRPPREMLGRLFRADARSHQLRSCTGAPPFELSDQLRGVVVAAVARGADPGADGALESAVAMGSGPLLKLLLELGADPAGRQRPKLLELATKGGHAGCVVALLETRGADNKQ